MAKSLVVTDRTGETVRYRQLMTIREYAAARLAGTGELPQFKPSARWPPIVV